MRKHVMLTTILAASFFASITASSCAQEIVDGKVHVPERRIEGFIYDGADRQTVMNTLEKISTREGEAEGSWVHEWMQIANAELERAKIAAEVEDRESAERLYFSAANYFAIAGFPEFHSKAEKDALKQHFIAYERGGSFMAEPMEVVKIEAEGESFKAYLHKPQGVKKPPLILWTHGTDKFKGHAYKTVKRLLDKGFAVVTFDLAGTGESTFWNLRQDGEFVHMAVLEAMASREDIDTGNIFEVGVSFGGHYAAKMAAQNDPRLRAVASLCGPVHSAFMLTPEQISAILETEEGATVRAFAHRIGADVSDPESVSRSVRRFSLVEQGLIGQGATIETPLLVMNGGRDSLAPISDLELLADSAETSELWVMGMAGHCARDYFEPAVTDAVEWLWQYAVSEDIQLE